MKSPFLLSMVLMAGAGVLPLHSATQPTVIGGNWLHLFPGKYAKDGKSFLYTYERPGTDTKFWVYDEDLQLDKTIEVKGSMLESKYMVQERAYAYEIVEPNGSEHVTDYILEINGTTTGLSIDRVQSYLFAMYGRGEIATLVNGVQVVATQFWDEDSYGKKYPVDYYREINGEWRECQQGYDGQNWGPFGKWLEPKEESSNRYREAVSWEFFPDNGGESSSQRLSRGIFGDDYNYLMPDYEAREYEREEKNGETVVCKIWGTVYEVTGYTVYDSSNKEVMSFKCPEGYIIGGSHPYFFELGDSRYFAFEADDDNGNEFYLVYRLGEGNSVSFVTAAPFTKVSPRNPKRGETVSVTLESPVVKDGAMVQVVSASGQTLLNTKIPAGQTQLDINTSGYPQGMYVVTVSGNGITKEAAKIIVR